MQAAVNKSVVTFIVVLGSSAGLPARAWMMPPLASHAGVSGCAPKRPGLPVPACGTVDTRVLLQPSDPDVAGYPFSALQMSMTLSPSPIRATPWR
jgi:hypothetical protein